MKLNYVVLLFALSLNITLGTTYYSKPQAADYKVGDIFIEDVTQTRTSGTTNIKETSTLKSVENFSGNEVQVWESVKNTTSPTVSTEVYRQMQDKDGIFIRYIDSTLDYAGLGLYKRLSKNLGNTFAINSTIIDTTTFSSASLGINGISFSGYGVATVSGTLLGVEIISTNMGNIQCFKIQIDSLSEADLGNSQYGKIAFEETAQGTWWHSNTYGVVKSNLTISRKLSDDSGYSEEDYYTEDRIMTLSSVDTSVSKEIVALTNDGKLQNNMNGWMWMGSLPWIYNANTGNWGYLANQELYVWDASETKWLTFNQSTQAWNYAQN